MSKSSLGWTGIAVVGAVLACIVVLGRVSLFTVTLCSLCAALVAVLITLTNRSRLIFLFFLNALFLVVPQRMENGVDVVVLLSAFTIVLTTFSLIFGYRSRLPKQIRNRRLQSSVLISLALVAFACSAIISTLAASEKLIALLPWLNGVALGLLVNSAGAMQLPPFASARRAVLAAGGAVGLYDIYLLASGRALNTGPFNAGRFTGSLGDYELLAEFYGAIILLCMTSLFFEQSRGWRVFAGVLVVPAFVLLMATQSRGPILTLGILAPAFAGVSIMRFRESAGKILGFVISIALVLYFAYGSLSSSPLFARLTSLQFDGGLDSTINRAGVWSYFTQMPSFANTGLVGNGFVFPYEEIGTYPHSIYLWLLWSGGALALCTFCLLVLALIFRLLCGVVVPHSASLSAAALIIYMLLDEIKIEAARNSASVSFLWMTLSLALLASREQRKS